jgi:hypothetical protein
MAVEVVEGCIGLFDASLIVIIVVLLAMFIEFTTMGFTPVSMVIGFVVIVSAFTNPIASVFVELSDLNATSVLVPASAAWCMLEVGEEEEEEMLYLGTFEDTALMVP